MKSYVLEANVWIKYENVRIKGRREERGREEEMTKRGKKGRGELDSSVLG